MKIGKGEHKQRTVMELRARIVEGLDDWFSLVCTGVGENVYRNIDNDIVAIVAPCTQRGFDKLMDFLNILQDKDLCSKYEIAVFEGERLVRKAQPDEWKLETGMLEYLSDYQKRFWDKKAILFSPEEFEVVIRDTLTFLKERPKIRFGNKIAERIVW